MPYSVAEIVAAGPILDWEEHAKRSLFQSHMNPDCFPHVMEASKVVSTETLMRLNCARCNGSAWVAYWPALRQGATLEQLTELTDGLVNSG